MYVEYLRVFSVAFSDDDGRARIFSTLSVSGWSRWRRGRDADDFWDRRRSRSLAFSSRGGFSSAAARASLVGRSVVATASRAGRGRFWAERRGRSRPRASLEPLEFPRGPRERPSPIRVRPRGVAATRPSPIRGRRGNGAATRSALERDVSRRRSRATPWTSSSSWRLPSSWGPV